MSNITILDGAIGSILMEFCKEGVYSCNINSPEKVLELHKNYVQAGSNIICTNTFSANRPGIGNYDVKEVITAGLKLARKAVEGTEVKVALDIGPLAELLEPYGDLEAEECAEIYREIVECCEACPPDYILLETFIDLEMLKIAAQQASKLNIPMFLSMSFTPVGKTIMGNSVKDMVEALEIYNPVAIGLNCSLEPKQSLPVAKMFREHTKLPLFFKPNAGKPQVTADGIVYEDHKVFADEMIEAKQLGDVYIGGCCGTGPEYIKEICERISQS